MDGVGEPLFLTCKSAHLELFDLHHLKGEKGEPGPRRALISSFALHFDNKSLA